MKILMVSSEAAPFAKAGGLGDAVSALSRALARAGHDVRVLLPRYYSTDRAKLERVQGKIAAPTKSGEERAGLYKSYLPGSAVEVYFLDNESFYGRDGIYGSKAEPDFADNPERFAFLCRAAFQLCRKLGWIPDIMHAHDWPTSLVPVILSHEEGLGDFRATASALTIHNLGYQGVYPKETFLSFGLDWDQFHNAGFEFYDKVNLLKAGIRSADCLTTVSPSYARRSRPPITASGSTVSFDSAPRTSSAS